MIVNNSLINLSLVGINKASVRKNILQEWESNSRENSMDNAPLVEAKILVERKGSNYTPVEIEKLLAYYLTSHDEIVFSFPEDFSPLQVYHAVQKWDRHEMAVKKLKEFSQ